jgi:hypothetical protein
MEFPIRTELPIHGTTKKAPPEYWWGFFDLNWPNSAETREIYSESGNSLRDAPRPFSQTMGLFT